MSYISHHKNKKTGAVYAYSVESYWDKEKKAPRNKQVCLGRVDPETGEIIPSKRRKKLVERAAAAPGVTAETKVAGPDLILTAVAGKHGLDKLLKRCFPDNWRFMLSLAFFSVQKGLPLSRAEAWSIAHGHPFGEAISSQMVSELLKSLSEDDRQRFLSLWLEKVVEHDYLCYDITSVSSYSRHNEYTRFGYNRDREHLEQINLAMLFGQKSGLPAHYRRLPGNIGDVATLKTTMKALDYLNCGRMHFILDRGFYSKKNIDELYRRGHRFTVALPSGLKWVNECLDTHADRVHLPSNYLTVGENEALYAVTERIPWGEKRHRGCLHIYYNAERAAGDYDRFTRKLLSCREELLAGRPVEANESFYEQYLVVTETPKRGRKVTFNEKEIQRRRRRRCGFFCIFSNSIRTAEEALEVYRTKDVVENSFDDLKNQLDMKRLRVHSSPAMDGRLFLQFLALIIVSSIRATLKGDEELQYMSVRVVMEEMETLVRITYSNRYDQVFTEATPRQRKILAAFGVPLPE